MCLPGGFADFSSFGNATTTPAPAQPVAQPVQPAAPAAFPPLSSGMCMHLFASSGISSFSGVSCCFFFF